MSNHSGLEIQLAKIISDVVGISESRINSETLLIEDLGLDSFSATELLVMIEQRYKIKVSESDLLNNRTLGDWAELVFQKNSKSKHTLRVK